MKKRILSAILSLCMIVTMLPTMAFAVDQDNGSKTISLQYDDYETAIGNYNAGDSTLSTNDYLEIVEKNGVKYFHTKGIGSGDVTINNTSVSIDVSKANLSVFLVIGQSNATPQYGDSSTIYPPLGTAYWCNAASGGESNSEAGAAANLMTNYALSDSSKTVRGIFRAFADTWHSKTGKKVAMIAAAYGGSRISEWQKGLTHYQNAVTTYNTAVNAIDTAKYNIVEAHYLWLQGETDDQYEMAADAYYDKFTAMDSALRADCTAHTLNEAGILTVRSFASKDGSLVPSNVVLSGPRAAQYALNNNSNSDICMITNITDQWYSDESVTNWFASGAKNVYYEQDAGLTKARGAASQAVLRNITSGEKTFTTDAGVSRTVSTWYDQHYNVHAYNEMGADAASNFAKILNSADDTSASVVVKSYDGKTVYQPGATIAISSDAPVIMPYVQDMGAKDHTITFSLNKGNIDQFGNVTGLNVGESAILTVHSDNTAYTFAVTMSSEDANAVAQAKNAVVDGTVTVAVGADQSVKTAAVQKYVDDLLKTLNNGVTASVSYDSTDNIYSVTLSKGNATDTKTISMTIQESSTSTEAYLWEFKDNSTDVLKATTEAATDFVVPDGVHLQTNDLSKQTTTNGNCPGAEAPSLKNGILSLKWQDYYQMANPITLDWTKNWSFTWKGSFTDLAKTQMVLLESDTNEGYYFYVSNNKNLDNGKIKVAFGNKSNNCFVSFAPEDFTGDYVWTLRNVYDAASGKNYVSIKNSHSNTWKVLKNTNTQRITERNYTFQNLWGGWTNGGGNGFVNKTGTAAQDIDYLYIQADEPAATVNHSVKFSLNNLGSASEESVAHGGAYSNTLLPATNYRLPTTLKIVKDNGTELTAGADYTWNTSTGLLIIYDVEDNLTVYADGLYIPAQEVNKAKTAVNKGLVEVSFGATQEEKTAAVQEYVDVITARASIGVTAKVSYVSGNTYRVDFERDDVRDSKEIHMDVIEKNSELPSEYRRVDFIESFGNEYIDIGVVPKTNIKMDVDIESTNIDSRGTLGWTSNGSHENFSLGWTGTNSSGAVPANVFYTNASDNNKYIYSTASSDKNRHVFSITSGLQTIDGMKNGDTTIGNGCTATQTIYLLARHAGWNVTGGYVDAMYARLYGCKIWQDTGLIRNFVPCVRKSDLAAGLYDLVNNKFYTNGSSSGSQALKASSVTPAGSITGNTPVALSSNTDNNVLTLTAELTQGTTSNTYQWQKQTPDETAWTDVAGATEETLKLTDLTMNDNGVKYQCVVTNTETDNSTVFSTLAAVTLSITKGTQSAPQVVGHSPTTVNGKGSISGTTTDMEYNTVGADYSEAWTPCTNSMENLDAGTYYVRYKETEYLNASDVTTVNISGPSADIIAIAAAMDAVVDGSVNLACNADKLNTVKFYVNSKLTGSADGVTATVTQADEAENTYIVTLTKGSISDRKSITVTFKLTHTLKKTPAKAATCTEDGNDEYYTCETCGKIFKDEAGTTETTVAAETLNKTGHMMAKTKAKAATCTENGNNEYYTCETCGKIFKDEASTTETTVEAETLAKTGHTMVKTEAKAATYTESGNNEYYTCKNCNKVFKDEAGTKETTVEAETIAKLTRPSSGGSSSTTNTVSVSTASNGKVTMDKTTAKKGDTVTITVTPDAGYELGKLTVTDAKGNTIAITKKSDNKYTFTMPNGKVTVTSTFTKMTDEKPSTNGYIDVASSVWYNDAVKYVSDKGLMSGTGSNKFSPNASTTRGMLMTVLARYAGQDTTGTPWYQKGMDWAKANGVSDGTKPTVNITREQLVTMLYRYAGAPGANGSLDSFADSSTVSSYAVNAMQWAASNGIVNGSNGKLNPKNNATRAEVAAILMRFCEMSK